MIRRPVAVEPVKATMSTSGDVESTSPTRWSDEVTMLTTPGGMSVCSAIIRPIRVAFHGVSGAGLSTQVLPMARIGPSLLRMISKGKFHGTMTPTTPIGSFHTSRVGDMPMPKASLSGRSRFQGNCSIISAGQSSASRSGASSCGPYVVSTGQPTSATSSARSSSRSPSIAACSCRSAVRRGHRRARPFGAVERGRAAVDGAFHVGPRSVVAT